MASGFIILRDGRCLAVRHKCHDALLATIAAAMDDGVPLRTWLLGQIPGGEDEELGYGFRRAVDGEQTVRRLDLRGLTESNCTLFELAARRAEPIAGPYAPAEDVRGALERLRKMLASCARGEPPLTLSDWTVEAPSVEGRVGPGWEGSA